MLAKLKLLQHTSMGAGELLMGEVLICLVESLKA